MSIRTKLIIILLVSMIVPLFILVGTAFYQFMDLGNTMRNMAVRDSTAALNDSAIANIEQLSTNTANRVAAFLYARDADIRALAALPMTRATFAGFAEHKTGRIVQKGTWRLSEDQTKWICVDAAEQQKRTNVSTNSENDDMDGFHYRPPEAFAYHDIPLYDEITFIDPSGMERVKYVSPNSTKIHYPLSREHRNIADSANTYVKAERYFDQLKQLKPGDIYVSDVIGAYVGANYIGMYTPGNVAAAARERGYEIPYLPETQAYAGRENPNGQRFEGIVRWATPVTGEDGEVIGYVSFALNHDHLMELVDHITPMQERYTQLPSAYEGNYAFIWDYRCRSICHPRHNSIVGYDPATGEPQIPWLETEIYKGWQASGLKKWTDYVKDYPLFHEQSRAKKPAPDLTRAGLVGLDGRYLNNAPQCTGWMDLTKDGGSGSFYILWSGLYKLTTASAIPYYTGQYAPSEENGFSRRGFGFVAIGAGLDDFTLPAKKTEANLLATIRDGLTTTLTGMGITTLVIIALVIVAAIIIASYMSRNITWLNNGVARFRAGERQFRFNAPGRDEFSSLADSFDDMADSIDKSIDGPLCIIDLDHKIIYMNEIGLEFTKSESLEAIIGLKYEHVSVYPEKSIYCPIMALDSGTEAAVYYLEDRNMYLKGSAQYLYNQENDRCGYIVFSTDVTEIQEARNKAEQANRAKSDFLSNMSHEMRTPMNAIIGMTTIGKKSDDIERKDYCLHRIEDASTHLLGVINDVLDMSKIEAQKFDLSPVDFHFEKMLQRVVNVISFRVEEKHQQFLVHVDERIPRMLHGDDQRIAQVIANLLSNAVKFTAEGGRIELDTRLLNEQGNDCELQISVRDTGIGITAEQQSRLFSSFEQADSQITRKFGGTGLGLIISKNIVEMFNGRIWIDSELGQGATFTFTIHVKRAETPEHKVTGKVPWGQIHALLVSDAPDILHSFTALAKRFGFSCDPVTSGKEALEHVRQGREYDICFLDWNMPDMGGLELAHHLNKEIPEKPVVIMTTATEWSTIEQEAKDAGIKRFLLKPVFPLDVEDCIAHFFSAEEPTPLQPTPPEQQYDFSGRQVLLVEDLEINREIILTLLEPTNLTILCAENGIEAIEQFAMHADTIDLILMDIQMPEMDGLTAAKNIRALSLPTARSVPIIAMTANVFRADIDRCLLAGMNGHIGKPIDIQELLKQLHSYL
ncbi:MAG: response regulator [Desulfobulbus sp.]